MTKKTRKMKIVRWAKYKDLVNDGILVWVPCTAEHRAAVIDEMRKNGYMFSGYYHQYGDYGCPVFDDNTFILLPMRVWGGLIAELKGEDPNDMYMIYAWNMDDEVYPGK